MPVYIKACRLYLNYDGQQAHSKRNGASPALIKGLRLSLITGQIEESSLKFKRTRTEDIKFKSLSHCPPPSPRGKYADVSRTFNTPLAETVTDDK